jgi:LysR family nitrogen assimilation transcriptional regulator
MDIRQLRYFVKIIEYGSLGKASEKLHVAQPSLSQQMARLEEDLKVTLLVRSHQGVKPTAAGQALYRHSRLILNQMEQLRQDVKEGGNSESGTVAIGFPTTMATILAMPLFEQVRTRYPGIRLQIFESMSGYITELLANGRLDLAVLFRDPNAPSAYALPVFGESLYVLGEFSQELKKHHDTCKLAQLDGVPMVAPSIANGLRVLLERTFSRENLKLNIISDIDSLPTLLTVAESGYACTILPASAIAQRHSTRRLKLRRIIEPEIIRPASLCWSSTLPMNSATLAVKRLTIELIAKFSTEGIWTSIVP